MEHLSTTETHRLPGDAPYAAIPVDRNPYESLLVDVTDRCNMACRFCYNRAKGRPDLTVEHFEDICRRLPSPVVMKLAGGEPTLHDRLPDLIRVAVFHGHNVYVCSNGLRYRDALLMDRLEETARQGMGFCLGISMDGGTTGADAYRLITGCDCLDAKMAAAEALVARGFARICLTAIIVRGLNEDAIPELLEFAGRHPRVIRYIHLRNAGRVGQFRETEPYDIDELKALVRPHIAPEAFTPKCVGEIHCSAETGRECCYRFRPSARLQVSLIEFASERGNACPKRGRIPLGSDAVVPLFLSMQDA